MLQNHITESIFREIQSARPGSIPEIADVATSVLLAHETRPSLEEMKTLLVNLVRQDRNRPVAGAQPVSF